MVKNPNWQKADQLAIYKRGRGVELEATEKQLQLAVRAGIEPGTTGFQVRRPKPLDHAASLPPKLFVIQRSLSYTVMILLLIFITQFVTLWLCMVHVVVT